MDQVFWMVWSPTGCSPTVKHRFRRDAEREAERLAGCHQGTHFVVLEAVASVVHSNVKWTRFDGDDDIPF